MDYLSTTLAYYATMLGVPVEQMTVAGSHIVLNTAWDTPLPGYGSTPFDMLVWDSCTVHIVSHSSRVKPDDIDHIMRKATAVEQIKYIFMGLRGGEHRNVARQLTISDYPLYEQFFLDTHPNANDISWLRDYFSDCLSSGFSYGVEFDGKFVSVTDAPTMPYMADTVQEIGINTHPKFYGKGYASVACLAMIEALLSRGLCPMWSTTADNLSSQALAKRVGFEPLAKTKLITWNGCR